MPETHKGRGRKLAFMVPRWGCPFVGPYHETPNLGFTQSISSASASGAALHSSLAAEMAPRFVKEVLKIIASCGFKRAL